MVMALLLKNLQNSVVRRSLVVMCLVSPGFLLSYLQLYAVSRMLSLESFGALYAAISIENILFAPGTMLGFFFSREIAEALTLRDHRAALATYKSVMSWVVRWGAAAGIAFLVLLSAAGPLVHAESYALIAMICASVYTSYLVEAVRAGLQGLHRFYLLGVASLVWAVLRCSLVLAAAYFLRTAVASMGAIALAAIPIFVAAMLMLREVPSRDETVNPFSNGSGLRVIWFMGGLSLFTLLAYADVVMGYVVLGKAELGVYSASAILPKSVMLISYPIVQVFFPVVVAARVRQDVKLARVFGALGITLVIALSAAAALILFPSVVCDSRAGIKSCDVGILAVVSVSAIPICLLRILIMMQLAHGRDRHPLILLIPALVYFGVVAFWSPPATELAMSFTIFSCATFVFYALACMVPARGDRIPLPTTA